MNQILSNQFIERSTNHKSSTKFKIIFYFSIFIILSSIIFYIYLRYNSFKREKVANSLKSKFEILNLYSSNTSNYTAQKTQAVIEDNEPFVIGLLKIEKIGLFYPILSKVSDELLEISPCFFYGALPNQIGNMCIAGHNYANQTHFAKLHLLNIGDVIEIYDLNGLKLDYSIYSKEEIPASDISCLSQDTNNEKEITLVTCNSVKGNRLVIKAKNR